MSGAPDTALVMPVGATGASKEMASTSASFSNARRRPAGSSAAKASVSAKSLSTRKPDARSARTNPRLAPGLRVTITLNGVPSAAWPAYSRRWRSIFSRVSAVAFGARPRAATPTSSRLARVCRQKAGRWVGVGCVVMGCSKVVNESCLPVSKARTRWRRQPVVSEETLADQWVSRSSRDWRRDDAGAGRHRSFGVCPETVVAGRKEWGTPARAPNQPPSGGRRHTHTRLRQPSR